MIVFGRIIVNKRNASAMNSGAASVSELSTTVDAMTKLQSSDTIVVTTLTTDTESTNPAKNTNTTTTPTTTSINKSTDECTESTSDIDLTTPMSIPSISSRNNVSRTFFCPLFLLIRLEYFHLTSFDHLHGTFGILDMFSNYLLE